MITSSCAKGVSIRTYAPLNASIANHAGEKTKVLGVEETVEKSTFLEWVDTVNPTVSKSTVSTKTSASNTKKLIVSNAALTLHASVQGRG